MPTGSPAPPSPSCFPSTEARGGQVFEDEAGGLIGVGIGEAGGLCRGDGFEGVGENIHAGVGRHMGRHGRWQRGIEDGQVGNHLGGDDASVPRSLHSASTKK